MEKSRTSNRYSPVACQCIENAREGKMRARAVRVVLEQRLL